MQGEFAGTGAHEEAADTDVVAQVEELVEVEERLADVILADVDLEPLPVLLDLREAGLALNPDGHDAACDGGFKVHLLKLFGGEFSPQGAQLRNAGGEAEVVGIASLCRAERGAERTGDRGDLGQLLAAKLVEILFEGAFVLGQEATRFVADIEVSV